MGARNQVGIGLSYRPASLCSLAIQFQTRFLESIPRPIAGLKFSTQISSEGEEISAANLNSTNGTDVVEFEEIGTKRTVL
jgi:hypothetical protein